MARDAIVLDDSRFRATLRAVEQTGGRASVVSVLKAFGIYKVSDIKSNFDRQRDPDGAAWKPLKAATLERRRKGKRRGGTGPKILTDTAVLRRSIQSRIVPEGLAIGPTAGGGVGKGALAVEYAHFHQFGSAGGLIPVRAFTGFTDKDADVLGEMIQTQLERNVERAR
jgi:phage gpG-like protein